MGDEDRCDSNLFLDLPQLQLHLHTKLLVERAEAFIQEEKLWLEHERASQSHALLLAAAVVLVGLLALIPVLSRRTYGRSVAVEIVRPDGGIAAVAT